MIVVDASAVCELLIRTPAAPAIEDFVFGGNDSMHAPHLIDLEVAQVLRRYVFARTLSPRRGRQALLDLRDLRIRRYGHELFLDRIWELRENISAYDAAYVALAEALPATLLTRDRRLASSTGHSASIVCV
jgi:predicted nucleic acid-binding protein